MDSLKLQLFFQNQWHFYQQMQFLEFFRESFATRKKTSVKFIFTWYPKFSFDNKNHSKAKIYLKFWRLNNKQCRKISQASLFSITRLDVKNQSLMKLQKAFTETESSRKNNIKQSKINTFGLIWNFGLKPKSKYHFWYVF